MYLDEDGDGMPGYWEAAVGLGPRGAPGDATLDTDGDGVSNVDEYRAGSHPAGTFRHYLAEGATSDFLSTTLAIAGGGPILLTFQRSDGTVVRELIDTRDRASPLRERRRHPRDGTRGVLDARRIASCARRRSHDDVGPHALRRACRDGGHGPQLAWYFAEGATHSGFDLFYLLQNPGTEPAVVDVTYLLPTPATPMVQQYTIAPASRFTIWVNLEHPQLAATDVSAIVRSTNGVPILAERALYASRPGRVFNAGHAAFGIADLSSEWYFAEGSTGTMFDEFLTIANPGDVPADVDVTYLLPGGDTARDRAPRRPRESLHHLGRPRRSSSRRYRGVGGRARAE